MSFSMPNLNQEEPKEIPNEYVSRWSSENETKTKRWGLFFDAGLIGMIFGPGGILGAFFGKNANTHIVGLIVVALSVSGIWYTFSDISIKDGHMTYADYWNTILPLITTLIGYIFGVSSGKNEE